MSAAFFADERGARRPGDAVRSLLLVGIARVRREGRSYVKVGGSWIGRERT
jgi:hypothetical protein